MRQPSVFDFFQRFPDETTAREYFEKARWPHNIICLHCGGDEVWKIRGGKIYTCKSCRKQFSIKTGTVMEGSHIPLVKWLYAMYLFSVSRKGISSIQLSKELGITQKSAWFMAHRLRGACKMEGRLSGTVEADETYIGGKEKNKHRNKKMEKSRGGAGKSIVFGVRDRDGNTRAMVVDGTTQEQLSKAVRATTAHGSNLYTDEHSGYNDMPEYRRKVVRHSSGEYVRGSVHTNSIESFWALMKRAHLATFHHWSRKHLGKYVDEFTFKINTTALPAFDKDCGINIITLMVSSMEGCRLTYKELIA